GEADVEGTMAMVLWRGDLVETKAAIVPGMENHFALMFSGRVNPREAAQFKLMSYPELALHLRSHTTDVIVVGNWMSWTPNSPWIRSQIVENGYVMKDKIAGAEIKPLPINGNQ